MSLSPNPNPRPNGAASNGGGGGGAQPKVKRLRRWSLAGPYKHGSVCFSVSLYTHFMYNFAMPPALELSYRGSECMVLRPGSAYIRQPQPAHQQQRRRRRHQQRGRRRRRRTRAL